MQIQHRTHKAFSLVETAIVLAVVGLVIGGIWVAASAVSLTHKTNQMAEGANRLLATGASLLERKTTDYGSGSTNLSTAMFEILPPGWTASPARTPFARPWQMALYKWSGTGTPGGYLILLTSFPDASSCTRSLIEIGKNSQLGSIWDQASTYITTFPIPLTAAQSFCASGYSTVEIRQTIY